MNTRSINIVEAAIGISAVILTAFVMYTMISASKHMTFTTDSYYSSAT